MIRLPGGWKIGVRHDEEKKDYEKLNHLDPEIKIAVIRAQVLVDETRKREREKGVQISLPYRMQLKNDCAEIEKRIAQMEKGSCTDKELKAFRNTVLRLQTESEHILDWKYE